MTNLTKETEKYRAIFKPLEPYGYDIDILLIEDDLPYGWINIPPMMPNWKPKWDGSNWVETATEEEMNPVIKEEPTELDLLKQENDELKNRMDLSESTQLETLDMLFELNEKLGGGI